MVANETMNRSIEAIVFPQPGQVEVRRLKLPACGDNEIVVKVLYSMVSTGTELRVLSGSDTPLEQFPLIPGYIVVGEVVEIGPQVLGWKVGDLVSGRNPTVKVEGAHQKYGGQASHLIYNANHDCRPIALPQGAQPLDYVIAEIAAISLRGVTLTQPQRGESALVIGQGLIGALSAAWLHLMGCRVVAVDLSAKRLARAAQWGVAGTVNAREENAVERLAALCPGGADIVVEASATLPGLRLAYGMIRREAPMLRATQSACPRLLLQATFSEEVTIHPGNFFPGERVMILTPSDRGLLDRERTVEALRTGQLSAKPFIDRIVSYRDAPTAYGQLRDEPEECFSLIFDWATAPA